MPILPIGIAAGLSLFGDLTLFATLVTQLNTLHITLAEVGILLSIHRFLRIPGNPLVGWIYDRFGRRKPFLVGMLLAVISTAAYGLVSGFWLFLVARLAWGAAWALINVGGMTMVLDVSTEENRGRLNGIWNTLIWIGYAIGPLTGSILTDHIEFRPAMVVLAGLTSIGLVVALLFVRETRSSHLLQAGSNRLTIGQTFRALFFSPSSSASSASAIRKGMGLYSITTFTGDGVLMSTMTLLLTQLFGETISLSGIVVGVATASGIFLAVRSVIGAVISPGIGRFSDRVGRIPVIASALVAGLLGAVLLVFADSLGVILVGVILGALSTGIGLVVIPAYVGDHTPTEKQGMVMGRLAMTGDIGNMLGPVLAFTLAPLAGLGWVYGLCILVFGIGLLLLRDA